MKGSKPSGEGLTTLLELNPYENEEKDIVRLPFSGWQWSPNGNYLFIPINNSEVYIWDKSSDKTIRMPEELFHDSYGETWWWYQWSPDSSNIFILQDLNNLKSTKKMLFDLLTGEIKELEGLANEEMWFPVWIP